MPVYYYSLISSGLPIVWVFASSRITMYVADHSVVSGDVLLAGHAGGGSNRTNREHNGDTSAANLRKTAVGRGHQ